MNQITIAALLAAYAKKGYKLYDDGSINIIGVRCTNEITDKWDDYLGQTGDESNTETLRQYLLTRGGFPANAVDAIFKDADLPVNNPLICSSLENTSLVFSIK